MEENNCIPFLDVMVTREGETFVTSLYRKPTFSGLYTNFFSYISEKYKQGLIFSLLFRIFTLTVDWEKFHSEVEFLKVIFKKNSYPEHFIDKCIRIFMEKRVRQTESIGEEKTELNLCLPFMGRYSNDVKNRLTNMTSKYLNNVKLKIIWNSPRKLRSLFAFKDKLPMRLRSNILYHFTCNGCNSIYIGKTKRHFLIRAYEHLGISYRTGRKLTYIPKNAGVRNHLHQKESCHGNLGGFKIIGQARNDYFLRLKESILIQKFKPTIKVVPAQRA